MAMFVLAIIVLGVLLLYGRSPTGDQTAKSQKTTPAPTAVPQTPK